LVIIEAKKIGSNDIAYYLGEVEDPPDTKEGDWVEWDSDDIDQLERYCASLSVGYGVLTNGNFWDIYNLSTPGSFKEKRIKYFSVGNTEIAKSVEVLKLLYLRNVIKLVT
jgi:predicted type IV restriction endonuclease